MNQEFRTTQMLVVSALLLSAVTVAQTGTNDSRKSAEHHSKFSRVAFWRHHNDANKDAKQVPAGTTQLKPAVAKQSQASKTQVKAVSAKQPANKINQNQHTRSATYSAKKPTTKASPAPLNKSPQKSMTAQNTQQKNLSTK